LLVGICLSVLQAELFAAFLWLIECSVLFVFLLLLFFLNVKNIYVNINKFFFKTIITYLFIFYIIINNTYVLTDFYFNVSLFFIIDNYYEAVFNTIQNDLFVFFLSYYLLNSFEFIIVGVLLLVGSMVCVNIYLFNKNVRTQNNNSFFKVFNFFLDFSSFFFLRNQNLIKQGNNKASLKIYKKK
jgi:hypothetical protein